MSKEANNSHVRGGILGALLPFLVFVVGVMVIALSGAPDERGFWPILILALGLGLLLARDRDAYAKTVIEGMSDSLVMIMITAWILASIIGVLMTITGFVDALLWLASQVQLGPRGMVLAAFLICCTVSLSTGSSFATILICSPLLYPAGGLLGAHLPTLAGAILAGATFGDFTAPISDTTIASALSQKAEIGPTVRSRVKYIIPAMLLALLLFWLSAGRPSEQVVDSSKALAGAPGGMPMFLVPIYIIWLFLRGKHLLHGLLMGLLVGVVIGLLFGLLPVEKILSLDLEKMSAQSFVIDGMNRAVGISFFTILLMGLVATLKAAGLVDQLVDFAERYQSKQKHVEWGIMTTVWAAVMLTTHSVVAILMVSEFANRTGEKAGISPIRRANLLSIVVCIFPFLLPYFIPVILLSNTTTAGAEFGVPAVTPLEVGMHNFVSWGLVLVTLAILFFGYGRKSLNSRTTSIDE